MAEEKKPTNRGRKPKTEEKVNVNVEDATLQKELEDAKKENAMLADMLKQLKEQMSSIQAQVQPQVVIQQDSNNTRTVKVISMIPNDYYLSTQPNGKGAVYKFEKYGDFKNIKFTDLQSIISNYSKQFEEGMAILSTEKDYIDLNVGYIYETVLNKENMDSVIQLKSYEDVNIIMNMSEDMREKTLMLIAQKASDGYNYDYNLIRELEKETDIRKYIDNATEMKEIEEEIKKSE